MALVCSVLLLTPAPARALAPGDPDPTFASGGFAFYPLGAGIPASSRAGAVALQGDGKIVIAGKATDGSAHGAFMVARLNPNGSLDQSFADHGSFVKQYGKGSSPLSEATAALVQPDGQIVVGGDATDAGGRSLPLIVRLNGKDGTLDPSFGDLGTVLGTVPWGSETLTGGVTALAFQPDGRIVAGGFGFVGDGPSMGLVFRLSTKGAIDTAFGDRGAAVFHGGPAGRHASWGVNAVALQPDGRIAAAGFASPEGNSNGLVARLSGADGSPDGSFGSAGLVTYQAFPSDEGAATDFHALAIQGDGKLLAVGGATGSAHPNAPLAAVRLAGPNGGLDGSYGSGGAVLEPFGFASAVGNAVALQPDGKAVVGGAAADTLGNSQMLVARLDGSGGRLDTSFGSGGSVLSQLGSAVAALTLQPDGKIVAAGTDGFEVVVARLIGNVAAPPGGGPPSGPNSGPSQIVATLSNFSISPSVFSAAISGPSIARTVGTTVSYNDTAAVTTLFTVFKRSKGVRHKHRCMRAGPGRAGRRCIRWVVKGRFTHADSVGRNSFHFTGRVANRALKRGRYRLRARPRFFGPSATAVTAGFRIVP